MTSKVGIKGQVVIPKHLRDQAGLGPGAGVQFEPIDGGVVIRRAEVEPAALRGRFARSGMAARLLDDRRLEPR